MNALLYTILVVVIFLLGREIMAWYWKTNQIIDLLEDIKRNTQTKDFKEKDIKEPKF